MSRNESDVMDKIRKAHKVLVEASSKAKKSSSKQTSIQAPIEAPTVVGRGKRKKVGEDVDAYLQEPTIDISFPSSVHACTDVEPYLPQLQQLLFPKDRETFDNLGPVLTGQTGIANIFKGLQALLYLTEQVEVFTREKNELETSNAALSAEVVSLKGKMTEFEALKAEHKTLLESKKAHSKSLQFALANIGALRNRIAILEAEATVSRCGAEVRVRAEMMRDYMAGKAETWNAEKIFKDEDTLSRWTASGSI